MTSAPERSASQHAAIWAGTFGSFALRFVLNIAIARLAGADQMGVYVAISTLIFIAGRISDLGLPNSIAYFARLDIECTRRCACICVAHCIVAVPASAGILWGSATIGLLNSDSAGITSNNLLLVAALASAQTSSSLLSQLLVSLNCQRSFAVAMNIGPLILLGGCILYRADLNAIQILRIALLSELAAAIFALQSVFKAAPAASFISCPPSLKLIYSYSIKTYLGTSMKALAQKADKIILSWFIPNAHLAAYAIAISLRDSSLLPVNTHALILRNRLIDAYQQTGNDKAAKNILKHELSRWCAITAGIGALLSVLAPVILPSLYGTQFQSTTLVLVALAAALPAITISIFCWTALLSNGKAGIVSIGLTLGGILNIASLYVGARWDGIIGACWCSLFSAMIVATLWLFFSFGKK